MKRSEPLVGLSREHHTALSLARRARLAAEGGDPAGLAAMAAEVRERFESELLPHFQEEETWLLPALIAAGDGELALRTLAEHGDLVRLVEDLAVPDGPALQAFADSLAAHVRFEERILFPAAEAHPEKLKRA